MSRILRCASCAQWEVTTLVRTGLEQALETLEGLVGNRAGSEEVERG